VPSDSAFPNCRRIKAWISLGTKLAHLAWFAVLAGLLHFGMGLRRGVWVERLVGSGEIPPAPLLQRGETIKRARHAEAFTWERVLAGWFRNGERSSPPSSG
jgi:hypothetical protein